MAMSRIGYVMLVAGAWAASASSAWGASLVANGDFESSTSGVFDAWTYVANTTGGQVAAVSTTPTVLGGTQSAILLDGSTDGGLLGQTVSTTGLTDFTLDLDFAVLETSATGNRSFSIVTYSKAGTVFGDSAYNVDSVRVYTTATNQYQIQIYDGGWQNTGMFAAATEDIYGDLEFDDGETPVLNHLTIVGSNYGTSEQSVTITLTANGTSADYTRDLAYVNTNSPIKDILFYSSGSSSQFLVDNVSLIEGFAVPEPSTGLLLATGAFGLAVWSRRRPRRK